MRILIEAYACTPGAGTESGFGWGWPCALAKRGHEVTVLTRDSNRAAIDRELASMSPTGRPQFCYVGLPRVGRWATRGWRNILSLHWITYVAWQHKAVSYAAALHARRPFDVAHHVTYGSIVPGTPLWRLGIPLVFGPVGSGQRAPLAAWRLFGISWPHELLRSIIVSKAAMRLNPFACTTMRRAAVVLATNEDTRRLAEYLGAARTELMCDTGIDRSLLNGSRHARQRSHEPPRVIWVGKNVPRKALRLAIAATAVASRHRPVRLCVVGSGSHVPAIDRLIDHLGVGNLVDRLGQVTWGEVQQLYRDCDIFLFTSVRESFGSQVVEAAAAGLPIVAIDLHGVASVVPPGAALKVPFVDHQRTASSLAESLTRLLADDDLYAQLSAGAARFAATQAWDERAASMTSIYREITEPGPKASAP